MCMDTAQDHTQVQSNGSTCEVLIGLVFLGRAYSASAETHSVIPSTHLRNLPRPHSGGVEGVRVGAPLAHGSTPTQFK